MTLWRFLTEPITTLSISKPVYYDENGKEIVDDKIPVSSLSIDDDLDKVVIVCDDSPRISRTEYLMIKLREKIFKPRH